MKDVSNEGFVFKASTFSFWGMSRTKASFSQPQLSVFEGCLARKLRFHELNFQFLRDVSYESLVLTNLNFQIQFLRDVSHESFVFTGSTFSFWGMSRTKAFFSQAQLSVFEGCLARKLRFHNLSFQFVSEVSRKNLVFTTSTSRIEGSLAASFSQVEVAVQLRQKVAAMSLCRFFSFLEPFIFLFLKLQNRTFWALAPGFGFGAGFLGQRRVEMIWEWKGAEKSWDEVRRADTRWEAERRWDELRRSENNSEELRTEGGRDEKTWEDMTCADMSCEELRQSWEEMRQSEKRWDNLRWDDMGWVETTWHEKVVKSWEELRWDELRRMEKLRGWEELKREEFRWGEKRWESLGDMRRCENSCDQLRRVEMSSGDISSDGMRRDGTWKGMSEEWTVKRLLRQSAGCCPTSYRHSLFLL